VTGLADVSAVAAGEHHGLAITAGGTVWAWGMNETGQLGDGSVTNRSTAVQVTGLSEATGIAAGRSHSLAVKSDGTVQSWGANRFGQLGDGNGVTWPFPAKVNVPAGVAAVAAGYHHTLAARNDGSVWSWGGNQFGQLGDGTMAQRSTPAQLPSLAGMTKVAANGYQNLTLKNDASVWGWGSYNCGSGGAGLCITPVQVSGLSGVSTAIGAGQDFSLAVKIDGSVWSWGLGGYRLGYPESGVRTTPTQINGLSGVTAVAASEGHTLALRSDGTVWSWGSNQAGQLGDGTTTTRVEPAPVTGVAGVVAVAAGPYHSLAVRDDGTLWGWGSNVYGQLGAGMSRSIPMQIGGLSGIVGVAAGWMHSLAVRSDGTVWAMGENSSGRLGDGTRVPRFAPTQVAGLTGVVSVAAGVDHSVARKSDGTIWAWGDNSQGQVGDPRMAERRTPVQVIGLGSPDLSLTMSHSGNFTAGAQGSYSLSVTNVGATASSGNVRVTVTLPSGVSFVSGTGQGWSCSAQGLTVTCNNGAPFAPGVSSALTLTVRVGWTSYPGINVLASVSNAGDLNGSNNTAGDPVEVTPPPGYRFKAVTPCRVVDTRWPAGAFGGPFMGANTTRGFTLPQGGCGIPATAAAYSLNVTVVPRGPLEWLTLWPAGAPQPAVSTLNSYAGDVVANAAIVPAGLGGAVSVFVTNNTDVILDVNGYFESTAPSFFYRDTPCRVVDTRWPDGPLGGPGMGSGQTRTFEVPSSGCGITPNATAYAMNYTVAPSGYLGYLSTWPAGQSMPVVSTLNSWRGKVVANAAIVPAGTGGSVNVFVTDSTHTILDIAGHFGAGGGAGALSFYPVTPCRVVDTRNGAGGFGGPILSAGSTRSFAVPQGGCGIPATAKAYSVNVTVAPSGPLTYLTTWPTGSPQPVVSTLNSWDGAVVANAAIVPAGTGGAISFFVTDSTHLILDINGYFQ
jgi:uncharacterized repeat protein (TIGR01451 family)